MQNTINNKQGELLKYLANLEEQRRVLDMEDMGPLVPKYDRAKGVAV